MIIKRYMVKNMNEAMTRIRYELGKDAVIISQRKVKKPGFIGIFSPKMIEVTAAVENASKKDGADNRKKEDTLEDSIESIKKLMNDQISSSKSGINYKTDREDDGSSTVRASSNRLMNETLKDSYSPNNTQDYIVKEMREMKSLISKVISGEDAKEKPYENIRKSLINNDIEENLAETLIKDIPLSAEHDDEALENVIEKRIKVENVDLKGPVVLVGPTGVGKTTTIAKLAGRMALIEKKKVGLITVDTYRIGAVDQLKTYAEIMNLEFKVVITIKEMEDAVNSMKDCDVILIDTTGRSSKNSMQISELRAFVQKVNSDNIHLVISATTKNRDIKSIVEGFKILNYNHVIITKLDETSVYGSILNILQLADKPISFMTTGQTVPDDITIFTKEQIAKLIMGEDNIC
ncbi:flagellar biosynthesis protein FlhF [Clostridium folliculivorans]|uniref:Flagellar biosynthesis protein FlhF n=1 Tax=Clostridium folliculivorans TaxID=2886038 RepID=A0A9W5XYU5_9CLOT|nr:flagellar biosynthesis protein FlhF [Clostridium folliculivorans]GKU23589.1 flagellar biosynthesis regulator FlhF [Clostridium folliculivorans]GKU29705.1 flagellar biosynthesis regulator FlhF [Clostridium folliculivorans]